MTATINIYDAKTQLSRLIDRAAAGEDIVIARAGKPIVRLVPVRQNEPRQPGELGHLDIPDDFFSPLSGAELKSWE